MMMASSSATATNKTSEPKLVTADTNTVKLIKKTRIILQIYFQMKSGTKFTMLLIAALQLTVFGEAFPRQSEDCCCLSHGTNLSGEILAVQISVFH